MYYFFKEGSPSGKATQTLLEKNYQKMKDKSRSFLGFFFLSVLAFLRGVFWRYRAVLFNFDWLRLFWVLDYGLRGHSNNFYYFYFCILFKSKKNSTRFSQLSVFHIRFFIYAYSHAMFYLSISYPGNCSHQGYEKFSLKVSYCFYS